MHSQSNQSSKNTPEDISGGAPERVQLLRSTDRKPSGRGRCYTCFRPMRSCLCAHIKALPVNTKFIILMHPKEFRRQRTGTGIITSLMLKDAEYHVGIDFRNDPKIEKLMANPEYVPALLYPGEHAVNLSDISGADKLPGDTYTNLAEHGKKLLVFVLDGTWWCAKKMYQANTFLHHPHVMQISFTANFKSRFIIKKQPADYCLSTIESCQVVLHELCGLGIEQTDGAELLDVFAKLVNFQLNEEAARAADEASI